MGSAAADGRVEAHLTETGPRLFVRRDGRLHPTHIADLAALAEQAPRTADELPTAPEEVEPLRPLPILRGGRTLFFAGFNFRDHVDENPDAELPKTPFFFTKLSGAVIGPGEPIRMPYPECSLDYEVELAVVIRDTCRNVAPESALERVLGYTVVNDVTARDIQMVEGQHTVAKGGDTFCPASEALVLAERIADPADLGLRSFVADELRQDSSTAHQVFSLAELIAFLTRTITLQPGDVIATGTPAGVGHFMQPPAYLRPGQEVTVEVDGIASLTNPVVAGWKEDQ